MVVHVPANVTVPGPIHILYLSSGSGAAAPRLLAVLEEGASAELLEEFAPIAAVGSSASSASANGQSGGALSVDHLTTAVAEVELDDRSQLKHSYVQLEGPGAAHVKATLVNQGTGSSYSLTEASVGGTLTRHDISVEQLGEATQTQVRAGGWVVGASGLGVL